MENEVTHDQCRYLGSDIWDCGHCDNSPSDEPCDCHVCVYERERPAQWILKPTAGHDRHGQSVVYDEADGKDIAIVYDGDAYGPMIAAVPELLEALKWVLNQAPEGPYAIAETLSTIRDKARIAVAHAEPRGVL